MQTDQWKSTRLFCLPKNPLILTSGILAGVAAAWLRRAEATAAATLSSKSGGWCVDADKMDYGGGVGSWAAPLAIV